MYVAVSVMLLVLLKLTVPSMTTRLSGGGLSSMTRVHPYGMVTLLPATGFPPVVFALHGRAVLFRDSIVQGQYCSAQKLHG